MKNKRNCRSMETRKVVLFSPIGDIPPDGRAQEWNWFPYSMLGLGGMLKKHGFEVVVVDESTEPEAQHNVLKEIEGALAVGISSMSGHQIASGVRMAEAVKKKDPEMVLIWGGVHPSILPEQTIADEVVDIVVVGQGEVTLLEVLERLYDGKKLEDVEGIFFKEDGKVVGNAPRPMVNIKDLPGYDFSLIPVGKYTNPKTRVVSYISSVGCPFKCSFCNAKWGRKWMSMDVKKILDDLDWLFKKHGYRSLMFNDANFFVSKKRVMQIAEGFLNRGMRIHWKANVRAEVLHKYTDSELVLLEKSGLFSMNIGVESGSERVLKLLRKGNGPDDMLATAERLVGYNFEVHMSLLFGVPTETVLDLEETIKHVEAIRKANAQVKFQTPFYQPYPGTPLHDLSVENGFRAPKTLRGWGGIGFAPVRAPITCDEKEAKQYVKRFYEGFPQAYMTEFPAFDE